MNVTTTDLQTRDAAPLTPRQGQAVELIERYTAVAGERPSVSWLARRLNISRQSAYSLAERARERRARAALRG